MCKTVFLFSGQGSQYSGMGRELYELYPETSQIYDCGSEILGFNLKKACFEGTEAELAQTAVSQPAIFATSLCALACVRANGLEAQAVAGHSLGEYAAMVASGMLSMEDGFRVIKERSRAMQACAEQQDGGMAAVLGLESDIIARVCAQTEGYVVPVNYNSPAQTVIAGDNAAVSRAMERFAEMGKKSVRLQVAAAFHSKLMQPAADAFYQAVQGTAFAAPSCAFYSNVTGGVLEEQTDMPAYLARHLTSPVLFVDELNALWNAGYTRFIELGPNKVLTGLVKKTLKEADAYAVENQKTLEKLLSAQV